MVKWWGPRGDLLHSFSIAKLQGPLSHYIFDDSFEGFSPTYMIQLKRVILKSWSALQRRPFADMASQHSHLTYSPVPGPRLDLRGFHWIGFDLDYTVARYHNDLIRLVQQCTTRALEQSGYAPSCFDGIDESLIQKGIIVDLGTGDLIKLDALGHVRAALHGQRWRSIDEIYSVYGDGPWRFYDYLRRQERHDGYWLVITPFDAPMQPLWARIVELMDRCDPRVSHVRKGDYDAVRRQ